MKHARKKKIRLRNFIIIFLLLCVAACAVLPFTPYWSTLETLARGRFAGLISLENKGENKAENKREDEDTQSTEAASKELSTGEEIRGGLAEDPSLTEDPMDFWMTPMAYRYVDIGVAGMEILPEKTLTQSPEDQWRMTFSPVPASAPVEEDYFDDALFIGDSRVMGLMLYAGLNKAVFYTEKGVNVNTLLRNPIVTVTGGAKISIPEALKNRQFAKIYIKTGINELGWRNREQFIGAYGKVIDWLRESQPDAVVYVQSILPVSKRKAERDSIINNIHILAVNDMIQKMTWEKDVHYLDVFGGLVNEDGCLPEEAGSDGVHLNKEYCQIWLDYLKRHTVRADNKS